MTMRMTWRYLGRMFAYAPILSTLHAMGWVVFDLTGLIPGLVARTFFDRLESGSGDIWWPLWTLIGVTLVETAIWLGAGYSEIRMRFTMSSLIRMNLLRSVLKRPGGAPLGGPVGDTISRFRDDGYAVEDALDWRDEIVMAGIVALTAFGVLVWIDPVIAFTTILPVIAITFLARLVAARLGHLREQSSQATSDVTGSIGDMIVGIGTLQSAGATERALASFRTLSQRRKRASMLDQITGRVVDSLRGNLVAIGTGGIMLLGAARLQGGELSLGDFVLMVLYFNIVVNYVSDLGQFLAHFRQTGVAIERLNTLVDDPDPFVLTQHTPISFRGDPPPDPSFAVERATPPLERLEIDGLTCRHGDGAPGISDISLTIERGQLVVVTGLVGSGKSMLLRAVMGLIPADAGEIRWNGQPLTDLPNQMTPPRAAYIGQVPNVFSDSLRNNILLGKDDTVLQNAISSAVLDEDIAAFPEGVDTGIGSRGVRLSGGQAQRTATARMLAHGADLLVIDDLSSALDVETEAKLWDRLLGDRRTTCLAVSHRHAALLRANLVIVMHEGRIVAQGTLDDLRETNEEMRRLWEREDAETRSAPVRALEVREIRQQRG